jgi:hypothetical protein
MQRVAWTDERLDDLSQRVGAGFERVDRDIRDLRIEMRNGFAEVRAEIKGEVGGLRGEVRSEIGELRTLMYRLCGGIFVAVIGAAILQAL